MTLTVLNVLSSVWAILACVFAMSRNVSARPDTHLSDKTETQVFSHNSATILQHLRDISATCLCLCNSTESRRPVGKGQKVSADWSQRIADLSQFAEYSDLITGKCSMEKSAS